MQQLENLLGPQGLKFAWWIVAFVAVLVLVVVVLRILRALIGSNLNISDRSGRGRAPRLGVTEYFNLDRQGRRLVMVRRDNVEHLVLIGGPNDVLIEANIVRADRSSAPRIEPRDTAPPRHEPEDPGRIEPPPMLRPAVIEAAPPPEPVKPMSDDRQPVANIPREELASRLEEALRKPLPQRTPVEPPPPAPPIQFEPPAVVFSPSPAAPPPSVPAQAMLTPAMPTPAMPAPAMPAPAMPAQAMPAPAAPAPEPAKPAEIKVPDLLADVLRRPAPPETAPSPPAAAPQKPAQPTPAPSAPAKNPFDSLEEEMARLLGRGLGDKP